MKFQRLAPWLILLIGCGGSDLPVEAGEEIEPSEEQEIQITENAVVVDSTILSLISDSTERANGTFRFQVFGSAPEIEIGDVIVGEQEGGFLRRVVNVSRTGDTITTSTAEAALADIIQRGSFETSFRISTTGGAASNISRGVAVAGGGISLDNTVLYDGQVCRDILGNPHCNNLKLVIEKGSVDFNPTLDIGGRFRLFSLEEFRAVANGSIQLSIVTTLAAGGEINKSGSIRLATFRQPFVMLIGHVPVVGVVRLDFVAVFSVETAGPATITTGFNTENSVEVGTRYQNSAWEAVFETDGAFNPEDTSWDAVAGVEIKLSVRPEISIFFYGVIGPFLEIEPYLRFNGVTSEESWSTKVSAAITAELGVKLRILWRQITNWSTSVSSPEVVILEDEGEIVRPPPSPKIFTASGTGDNRAPSDLYLVEVIENGSDSLLGRLRTSDGFEPVMTDIAFSSEAGLWGVSFENLYRIDTVSTIVEEVGSMEAGDVNALAFDSSGKLYAANVDGFLFRIDTLTARSDTVGNFGSDLVPAGDIAFSPSGELFAAAVSALEVSFLVSVDTANGEASFLGFGVPLGFNNVWGLSFVGEELFGFTTDINEGIGKLIKININEGTGEFIRNLNFNAFGAGALRYSSR